MQFQRCQRLREDYRLAGQTSWQCTNLHCSIDQSISACRLQSETMCPDAKHQTQRKWSHLHMHAMLQSLLLQLRSWQHTSKRSQQSNLHSFGRFLHMTNMQQHQSVVLLINKSCTFSCSCMIMSLLAFLHPAVCGFPAVSADLGAEKLCQQDIRQNQGKPCIQFPGTLLTFGCAQMVFESQSFSSRGPWYRLSKLAGDTHRLNSVQMLGNIC